MPIPFQNIYQRNLRQEINHVRLLAKGLLIPILIFAGFLNTSGQCNDLSTIPDHFTALASEFSQCCFLSGSETVRSVALTFDDGPSEVTERVLGVLKKKDIKATFFWQGKNLSKHQSLVRHAMNEGHEFGNHSWDHPNMYEFDTTKLWSEQVMPTLLLYDSLFQLTVNLFRPPYGATSSEQIKFLNKQGISTVLWSLSTLDWDTERNSAAEIAERFRNQLCPGAIVLLHDVKFGSTDSEMIIALESMISYGLKNGYQFVTVSDIIKNR